MDASSNFTVTGTTGPQQPEGYHQGHSQGQHPTHAALRQVRQELLEEPVEFRQPV